MKNKRKERNFIIWYVALNIVMFVSIWGIGIAAYAKSPPSTYRSNPYNIKGFNPNYQYHGYGRGGGSIDWDRNTTRQEYNRRCAYNPAVCVRWIQDPMSDMTTVYLNICLYESCRLCG